MRIKRADLNSIRPSIFSFILLCGGLGAGPANAAIENVSFVVNASTACKGALPVYNDLLRRRPLALSNDDATRSAFVTCAPPQWTTLVPEDAGTVYTVSNARDTAVSVSCTGVMPSQTSMDPVYVPVTVQVPAGGQAPLRFLESQGFAVPTRVSCVLPALTSMTDIIALGGDVETDMVDNYVRVLDVSPVVSCTSPTRRYDDAIRYLSDGQASNGSTTNAFITCAQLLWLNRYDTDRPTRVDYSFRNPGTTPVFVSCTGVARDDLQSPPIYLPLTFEIDAGSGSGFSFMARYGAVSCVLPKDVWITRVSTNRSWG